MKEAEMSKRMKQAIELIDKKKKYTAEEAIKLARESSKVKFDAAVEVHVSLDVDVSKSDQNLRTQTKLPHGTGKTLVVAAFVSPEKVEDAKKAGADVIGGEELVKKIKQTGKTDFDIAVAEPGMMKELTQIAKILGQRRLMPTPKTGTVGPDIAKIISELKSGKIDIKMDKTGNLHQAIGKVSYDETKLVENLNAYIDAVKKAKPSGVKTGFIKSAVISTSMGPSIKLAV